MMVMRKKRVDTPGDSSEGGSDVVRLKPYHFIHILDNNTNVQRVIIGPCTYTRLENEVITRGPEPCVCIPPQHFCIVENPVERDDDGNVVLLPHGQVKIRRGDTHIRFHQEPFALYPEEEICTDIQPLRIVQPNTALKLVAIRDYDDRQAGEEWLEYGPCTYVPHIEAGIVELITASVIAEGCALRLRAKLGFTAPDGTARQAGEEYLRTQRGAYIPHIQEEVVEVVKPTLLDEKTALHLEALLTFTDCFGKKRNAGEKWLVTIDQTEAYLPCPAERIVQQIKKHVLTSRQFCVVENVFRDGKSHIGQREIRIGHRSFFLHPLECIPDGIQDVFLLDSEEGVLLLCIEAFEDEAGEKRQPGDKWMVHGPCNYVPPTTVEVVEKRRSIPLALNEGVYVRDTVTGQVRQQLHETYMLKATEELWEKPLSEIVEGQLAKQGQAHSEYIESGHGRGRKVGRDRTRVVNYKLPHNTVAQIYDFKARTQRLCFGPDMILLGPNEDFTVLSLSGSEWVPGEPTLVKPKVPDLIKSLYLFLGPDSMSDVVTVETADHARLSLTLSYSWFFDVPAGEQEAAKKVFNVPDFVGDCCKAVASRIRGAVAAEGFDAFHKHAPDIINAAVFGIDTDGKPRGVLEFPSNKLKITGVDIQNIDCIDTKTKDSLQKSVKLAIEITTASQEAVARHGAETREQSAKGALERQSLADKAAAEEARKGLLALQAESAAIESTGASKAEAKAQAESRRIEGDADVQQAQLRAEANQVMADVEINVLKSRRDAELDHRRNLDALETAQAKQLAQIEVGKFQSSVGAIGKDTIAAMARAGPEAQVRMLKGLGLQGYLMTDGNSPINLMNTAQQLAGAH